MSNRITRLPSPLPVTTDTITDNLSLVNIFDEITSVAASTLSTIVTYTVPVGKNFFVQNIEFGGCSIARYDVYIDSVLQRRKYQHWGAGLHGEFRFCESDTRGLELGAGAVVELKCIHERTDVQDFTGTIIGILEG